MPSSNRRRAACVCALAFVLSLSLGAQALAAGGKATLRVVGKGGRVLSEGSFGTGAVSVETSPKADCFGAETAGSGAAVKVRAGTALSLLANAARSTGSLRPLLLTDAFDFGLGLCGVGDSTVSGKASWYLKVNHKGSQLSGDATKVRAGDEVLWDLAPSYPYPDELALAAPRSASAGVPFVVHVYSYDEKGKRRPAKGIEVPGAAAPTGSDGSASVTLMGPAVLRATGGAEIPSAAVPVCVGGSCPSGS